MKIRIRKFISVFLVAIIGFTVIGSTYFFGPIVKVTDRESQIFSYSDLIPKFDQGIEFSSANINVPEFKALDTVFDFVNELSDFLFSISELSALKLAWLAKSHLFFKIQIFLFPFHYFW